MGESIRWLTKNIGEQSSRNKITHEPTLRTMVAKITTPKSIEAALNYNEKKVQKGNAVCLHAANYLNDAKKMNFYQKLNGFERLNSLNERATTKTLHVSPH